ncbi:hypothetical protein PG994_010438 [Apiospora phragmitis]|uniref:Uncharacterized protein n=1 Tax=Apiospora phragmitis TaxID=2905665 RepID=A0ABR1TSJ3_9PEZI
MARLAHSGPSLDHSHGSLLINTVGVVAAALVASTSATKSYKIADKYSPSNFYDKWNFVTVDPNNGYVDYQTQQGAKDANLVQINDNDFYLGVDYKTAMPLYWTQYRGRKSVRVESQQTYNHGLFIGDFSHLLSPLAERGLPSVRMFGSKGEFDFLENWNDLTFNRITAHVGQPTNTGGACTIKQSDMSAQIVTTNCADIAPGQYDYQACSANSQDGIYGSDTGGSALTLGEDATEWTSEYIRLWSWKVAPADILAGNPDPSKWGMPMFQVSDCNIDKAFADLKFVLNINFCSVANQPDKWGAGCSMSTGKDTCMAYVAANGGDFQDLLQGQGHFRVPVGRGCRADLYHQPDLYSRPDLYCRPDFHRRSNLHRRPDLYHQLQHQSLSTSAFPTLSLTEAPYKNGSMSSSQLSLTPTVGPSSGITSSGAQPTGSPVVRRPIFRCPVVRSHVHDHLDSFHIALYTTICPVSGMTDAPKPTTISAPAFLTQTQYVTKVYTITSCAPTVTNCPVGSVTTQVGTTTKLIPVVTPTGKVDTPASTTETKTVTRVWTITSCAPTVTNCPVGSVTTQVRTQTTVVPVVTPGGNGGSNTKNNVYPVVGPSGGNGQTTTVLSTAKHTQTNTKYIQLASASAAASSKPSTNVGTVVYVTAAVVPVLPSANAAVKNNGTTNDTTNGTAVATPSKPVAVPVGTLAAGCSGSGCKIAASGAIRSGATSAALVVVAGLFFALAL